MDCQSPLRKGTDFVAAESWSLVKRKKIKSKCFAGRHGFAMKLESYQRHSALDSVNGEHRPKKRRVEPLFPAGRGFPSDDATDCPKQKL